MDTTYDPNTLSTWSRERSVDELQTFVTSRLASLEDVELDIFN